MSYLSSIPKRIIPGVKRHPGNPLSVSREFSGLLDRGAIFRAAGIAGNDPSVLFKRGLKPKHKIELFDTVFYLTNVRQIPELRFFVGYVAQKHEDKIYIHPVIIYKDLSLSWRSASHFTMVDGDIWIGKGDVRVDEDGEFQTLESIEATTDMPLEMQSALESLLHRSRRAANGDGVLELVLKQGTANRIEPFADFTNPRKRAQSRRQNLINENRSIARFTRKNDPTSLAIVTGFEPDFANGVIDRSSSHSKLYGGRLRRFRVVSVNRIVQYYFFSGARHVWIIPAQATTIELSCFGVRTIDVLADDDLFIPGFEYHFHEKNGNGFELYSQIPPGFAGETCPVDDVKADASTWLDQIPLIKKFRRDILKQKGAM